MKSKFMRILALILVMSSLLSMFTVFAYANETDGSETEGEPEDNTQESSFTLMYNRTFDEGWNVFNGLELNDQGTTGHTKFEIDYEETVDYKVNYFMRVELDSSDNDFVQMNCGAKANVGAVFEFDMKTSVISATFFTSEQRAEHPRTEATMILSRSWTMKFTSCSIKIRASRAAAPSLRSLLPTIG